MATIDPIQCYHYLSPFLVHGQFLSVDIHTGSVAISVDAGRGGEIEGNSWIQHANLWGLFSIEYPEASECKIPSFNNSGVST
ncbi:uncharacterized protein Bfra_009876 [Botrytis fragariae]|uniref:Uncharacterized protein n=1 Tax=Botrytis fragariae TaxID=1964551 RepID=A0A8H6AMH9_9HELO|nr:uncharacterized protein Bfra_009876 [Botrytis fragariae]KAF5870488.1 hypothetical protein Bfra_009876 [Botrytis fragariae]